MSIFKKTAAIVCSAATLCALGATAMTASAEGTVVRADEVEITISEAKAAIAGSENEIPFSVYMDENPGYAAMGIRLLYNYEVPETVTFSNETETDELTLLESEDLVSVAGRNENTPKVEYGAAADKDILTLTPNRNQAKGIVGLATMGDECVTASGLVVTYYFQFAEATAEALEVGDEFPILLQVREFADEHSVSIDTESYTVESGVIRIVDDPEETTTTTTTTEETTTTTESSATESSDTSASATSASTSATTASAATTKATTTAAPTKTGDAGVGIAVAGLLAAGAAAVVLRKKED